MQIQMKVRTTFEASTDHPRAVVAKEVRDTVADRAHKYLRFQIIRAWPVELHDIGEILVGSSCRVWRVRIEDVDEEVSVLYTHHL